jgi:glycosyltransferase involved in cell wall biosynthesis
VTRRAVLVGYKLDQPSFRYRMQSLVAPLMAAGWDVRCEALPPRRYGLRTWERRVLWRTADVVVLQQIKMSAPEAFLLARLARACVFDLDDAIYVRKPRRLGLPAEDTRWRRAKFRATCRAMDVVVVGNEVLARVARPAAREVAVLPTALDPGRYRPTRATADLPPTVVWIGSPENLIYLELVRPALARLTARLSGLRLRVVCSAFPDWAGIEIERVKWSPESEVEALTTAHVGIMPLSDDEWARGKCAFKLLQYMAASLPSVASPVGANAEAVLDGVTGFHAPDDARWESGLERLLGSAELRARFGAAGRAHLDRHYALGPYTVRYLALLERLAADG